MSNCYSSQAEYEDHDFQGGICKDCGQVDKPAVKALSAQVSMLEQKVTELTERNRRLANQIVGYQSCVNDSLSEIIRTTKAEALREAAEELNPAVPDTNHFDQPLVGLTVSSCKDWLRARAEKLATK